MNLEDLKGLLAHMEWADAQVWTASLSSAGAGEDAQLRAKLSHTHGVQRAFLCVWRGVTVARPPADPPDLRATLAVARANYGDLARFVSTLGEEDLARPAVMPWAGGFSEFLGREPAVTTLAETMTQVAMHSTYHRGQVNTRLRELGVEPALTDYIAWLWFGRPEPAWPDASG
ncbi:MAG TPA: DinB family protein [Pyrinomonadaceae bacterium]|nr:DinB family protein [Pyrinomonadaceae bacterium]